jgi:hypothetical protein
MRSTENSLTQRRKDAKAEPSLLLRPAETARMLGLSARQLHRMACKADAGEAPGFPRGLVLPGMSDRRYRRADLEAYVNRLGEDSPLRTRSNAEEDAEKI